MNVRDLTLPRFFIIFVLALGSLAGCPPADDDDSSMDDDDATGDDDDATGDDDDATGDDDDATGDDDDATGDDDDATGDDDDSAGPCGADLFTTSLEVRSGGVAGTTFSTTDGLTFAGIVSNPCPFPVTITSISTCLVGTWTVDGNVLGAACGDAPTDFEVPGNDSIEELFEAGELAAGSHTIGGSFDVQGLTPLSGTITVQ